MPLEIGRPVRRPSPNDGTVEQPLSTPGFRDLYPFLCKFLVDCSTNIQTSTAGTITLFLSEGCFKLCINDRAHNRSAFVSGRTLHLALAAADAGIGEGRIRWRIKGYIKAPNAQKRFDYS